LDRNQRRPLFDFRPSRLPRVSNHACELPNGARLKQHDDLQFYLIGFFDLRKEPDTYKGVSSECEEVVVERDFLDAQLLFPPGSEGALNVSARCGIVEVDRRGYWRRCVENSRGRTLDGP
jgi:hypothetical protein